MNIKDQTWWSSCKARTTEAAQNLADGSSKGLWSMEANGQAKHVFSNMPTCFLSAQVHRTCGTKFDELKLFIKSFSFKTCASFPSPLILCFGNLFKLSIFSDSVSGPKESSIGLQTLQKIKTNK